MSSTETTQPLPVFDPNVAVPPRSGPPPRSVPPHRPPPPPPRARLAPAAAARAGADAADPATGGTGGGPSDEPERPARLRRPRIRPRPQHVPRAALRATFRPPPPVTRSFRPLQVVLTGVLTTLVGVAFGGFFAGGPTGHATALLVLAVACAAMLGCLAGARLRSGLLVGLVGSAGALLFSVLVLYPSRLGDGPSFAADFGAAVRDGWARMLTVGLPARPDGDLLVLPMLVLWAAAFAAAVLVVRGDAVLAPALPPLLGYVVALLLVAARDRSLLPLTGLIAAAALALAVVRAAQLSAEGQVVAVSLGSDGGAGLGALDDGSDPGGADGPAAVVGAGAPGAGGGSRRARLRPAVGRLTVGLPVVALVAVLGTGLTSLAPVGSDRFDPRDHRHPPVEITPSLNPLVQVKAARKAADQDLFTVRFSANGRKIVPDRVRTAVLSDFDGASWYDDGVFVRSGSTLGDDGSVRTVGADVRMEVTVEAPGGPFLPSLGSPTGIRDANIEYAYQPAAGVLAATDTLRVGDRYVLTARMPVPGEAELRAARPAQGPAMKRYLARPAGMPDALREFATYATDGGTTTYGKLTALVEYLRNPRLFSVDINARPGHSYGALAQFLEATNVAHRGYVEQFATAFALLARIENLPTRIAVGYLLEQRPSSAAGVLTATSQRAFAWPEVALDGIGWVGFDPIDISRLDLPPPPADDEADDRAGDGGAQAPPAQTADAVVRPELDPGADIGAGGGGSGGGMLLTVLLVGVLAVSAAVALGIVAEKARRRRRRARAGPAATRVAGAWREIRDRLAERGVERSRALSAEEVVERTRAVRGEQAGDRVADLVPVVGAALFAATDPDDADARHAWELTAAASRELRRADGMRRRVAAVLDPRPLLPRR
ncbi:transglutaminaseTgpA domain-containing protein [Frankia gtarii]|uniref:transglutaminase family protein n=2 Tax=Frankia gtarii TaxID=2950102 RepID=UPI0021C0EE06|nr:transglutaminase domain-containing protein [Frankia gtarii]